MDRNYTVFDSWNAYLSPLGVKSARVQAGWGKCEPAGDGRYQWDWLDEIVSGIRAAGVSPWLQTSFGNPAYPGGGTIESSSPLPSSTAAVQAWQAWVTALVTRYQANVSTWEIWNEPNIQHITAQEYANFTVMTASIIKSIQQSAIVRYGVTAGVDSTYAINTTKGLLAANAGGLVDQWTYHPYEYNPDAVYESVAQLKQALAGLLPHVQIVQGENGGPSVGGGYGALTEYNWTECSQAKWFSRRLLHDGGLGIPSSAFSIVDLCYADPSDPAKVDVNHKGLLLADCTQANKPVIRPKMAYTAVQHVTSVFDSSLAPLASVYPGASVQWSWKESGSALEFSDSMDLTFLSWAASDGSGRLLFGVYNSSGTPLDSTLASTVLVDLSVTITGGPATSPSAQYVGVDMVTGAVFALPQQATRLHKVDGQRPSEALSLSFTGVPVSDVPALVADPSLLHLA